MYSIKIFSSRILVFLLITVWTFAFFAICLSKPNLEQANAYATSFIFLSFLLLSVRVVATIVNSGIEYKIDISTDGRIELRPLNINAFKNKTLVVVEDVKMLTHTLIWSNLIILRLKDTDDRNYCLIILKDSVDARNFRRLKVLLRNYRNPSVKLDVL